jgi:AraC-like DNA-binding protein
MVEKRKLNFLAKIAVASKLRAPQYLQLASGNEWTISDVVCGAGPMDKPFEEQLSRTSIAVVVKGTFTYRCPAGCELMTPGSLLLGNGGDYFRCGHEHGMGDRCVSFSYDPEFFERIACDAGVSKARFHVPRLPPMRVMAPLVSRVVAFQALEPAIDGEELGIQMAAQATLIARGVAPSRSTGAKQGALAGVSRVVRMIDYDSDSPHDLRSLAKVARLSPYHFLRTFEALTGTTPHQYLLRMRLRRAAFRLRTERAKILDIALGCGFGDVSNFNRSFRAEFTMSPRVYRAARSIPPCRPAFTDCPPMLSRANWA